MKKLSLDLDTLVVEGFATDAAGDDLRGTVRGNADDFTADEKCPQAVTYTCGTTAAPRCISDVTRDCPTWDLRQCTSGQTNTSHLSNSW